MSFIASQRLVLLLLIPLAMSLSAIANPDFLWMVIAIDAALFLFALLDLLLAWRPAIEVTRSAGKTVSIARPFVVEITARNTGWRRLAIQVKDGLFVDARTENLPVHLAVDAGQVRHGAYRVTPMRRGIWHLGDHFVRYPSPAGLWIRQLRLSADHEVHVYPDVQAVRHFEMLARQNRDAYTSRALRLRGGDTEFERLRDYQPDDEFRRIDWKATARRKKLVTREYQLERNQNVVFLLDCGRLMTSTWDGLSALDYALNATLMLTHVAMRRGDHVGLIAFDETVRRLLKPSGGTGAANRMIQSTFDLFPSMVESNYEAAFFMLRTRIRRRTLVVFLGQTLDEATSEQIQRHARDLLPQHLPLVVLLKDREVEARAHHAGSDLRALCTQAAAAEVLLARDRLTTKMERAGVLTLDVLYSELTAALVSRYLEVKARGLI